MSPRAALLREGSAFASVWIMRSIAPPVSKSVVMSLPEFFIDEPFSRHVYAKYKYRPSWKARKKSPPAPFARSPLFHTLAGGLPKVACGAGTSSSSPPPRSSSASEISSPPPNPFGGSIRFIVYVGGMWLFARLSALRFADSASPFFVTSKEPDGSRRAPLRPPTSIIDACVLPQTIANASRPSNFVRWNSPRKCSSCIEVFFKVSESGNCGYDQ